MLGVFTYQKNGSAFTYNPPTQPMNVQCGHAYLSIAQPIRGDVISDASESQVHCTSLCYLSGLHLSLAVTVSEVNESATARLLILTFTARKN